jgi:APA family basic amino acid/polyamine antiporter
VTAGAEAPPGKGLLRVLGLAFGLAVAIGAVVGGGILRTPGEVAALLPTPVLFFGAWLAGAAFAFLGATAYAEHGAMDPGAGGVYPWARRAFGDYPAFLVGYNDWLQQCASIAALGLLIGEYSGAVIPSLEGRSLFVASAILLAFVVSQWRGIKTGAGIQLVTTALKAVALVLLVGAIFFLPAAAPTTSGPRSDLPILAAIILAMQGVIFTFDGYYYPIYSGEEFKNPGREIPRAIFVGLGLITALYVLLNVAFVRLLSLPGMAGDPFVMATAAERLLGPAGDTVLRGLMIVSILGTINTQFLASSRIVFSLSRDRLFPVHAVKVNAGGTPTTALLLSTGVAFFFLLSGTFNAVIATLSVFIVLNYLICFLALFRLRRTEPTRPRPYRAWGYPWTTGLAVAMAVVFLVGVVWSDPRHALLGLGVLALSVPTFWLLRRFVHPVAGA